MEKEKARSKIFIQRLSPITLTFFMEVINGVKDIGTISRKFHCCT